MKERLDWSQFGAVNSVKLVSDDGELHLLSGHDDGQLVVSRLSPGTVTTVKIISRHQDILWSIDVTSHYVTTCSEDATVAVYSREETLTNPGVCQEPCYHLTGHISAVTSVSLSANILVSGSRDRTVRVSCLLPGSSNYSVLAVLQVVISSPLLSPLTKSIFHPRAIRRFFTTSLRIKTEFTAAMIMGTSSSGTNSKYWREETKKI